MIIVMKVESPESEIERIIEEVKELQLTPEKIQGASQVVIGLVGDTASLELSRIEELSPWIQQVLRVGKPFKRASLEFRHGHYSEVVVNTPNGPVTFGKNHPLRSLRNPPSRP